LSQQQTTPSFSTVHIFCAERHTSKNTPLTNERRPLAGHTLRCAEIAALMASAGHAGDVYWNAAYWPTSFQHDSMQHNRIAKAWYLQQSHAGHTRPINRELPNKSTSTIRRPHSVRPTATARLGQEPCSFARFCSEKTRPRPCFCSIDHSQTLQPLPNTMQCLPRT
jgi:hypothetical protein